MGEVTEQWHNVPLLRTRALEGMLNGKKVRGRRRYQMIDNIMINGLFEDTKRQAEKRVERRMLSLPWKTCPLGRTLWLIGVLLIIYIDFEGIWGSVAKVVRRSPLTAGSPIFGVESLHIGFVIDETEPGCFFYFGIFSILPCHNISFHHFSTLITSAPVMVRHTWLTGILAIH